MSLQLLAIWSQLAAAVVFLVVAILIWRRFIQPGVKAYQTAKNAELAENEARREHMRADVAKARGEIETAEADSKTMRERALADAKHEHEKLVTEAEADAERIVRNAEGELQRARLAARDRLRVEFIEKALAKARAEAATRVDASTNARLVNETVDDLSKGKV